MAHDLSMPVVVEVIDVRRYQRAEIQCRLAGAASTAVVEVKQSMSPFVGGKAVSLPTTTTLTLNGSATTRIDTTDIAYLHIEVTTEDSGKAFELEYQRTRPMVGDVIERTLRADATISDGAFGAGSNIKAFILAQGDDSATAVFEVKRAIGIGYPLLSLSPAVTVALDGSTITEVDMSGGGFFEFDCTTTQADYTAHLMIYMRGEVDVALGSTEGTAFPVDPFDGQKFTRTDFDELETFTYDDTRGKWLGRVREFSFNRNGTRTTGGWWIYTEATSTLDDDQGFVAEHECTLIGVRVRSKQNVTCDLDFHNGGTKIITAASFSSSRVVADMTLNQTFGGDAADPFKVEFVNITAGTLDDPLGTIYYCRSFAG